MSAAAAANRIQLHMAKLGTREPETFQRATEIMASRPGYKVTGIVLTNKDGDTWIINHGIKQKEI